MVTRSYDIKSQPNRDPPPQTRNNISRTDKNTISQSSPITESFNQQNLHGTMFEKIFKPNRKPKIRNSRLDPQTKTRRLVFSIYI